MQFCRIGKIASLFPLVLLADGRDGTSVNGRLHVVLVRVRGVGVSLCRTIVVHAEHVGSRTSAKAAAHANALIYKCSHVIVNDKSTCP